MKLCIFEDDASAGLRPVNQLRHTSEIICGAFSLIEKLENFIVRKYEISVHCRYHLTEICREKFPKYNINKLFNDDYLFLNSRVIFTKKFIEGLFVTIDEFKDSAILSGKDMIALHVSANRISGLKHKVESKSDNNFISISDVLKLRLKPIQLSQLDKDETEEIVVLRYPSDMILNHEDQLNKDLEFLFFQNRSSAMHPRNVELINKKRIHISPRCTISPYAVLDASKGDIYISGNTSLEPFSYIVGPAYIGEYSTVRSGTKLYGPIRIGNYCKVSGELVSSILHSYVNKQHLGFLGHSYLCEWVNIGAGATTSNLKNNYSTISIKLEKNTIDTGSIFLGSIIGDHTKTGINSMLNTGTIIGISCNLYGSGYQPKTVSSFSWVDAASGKTEKYDLSKAINTAKISMKRRNVNMSRAYENLLSLHYKNTRVR
jgi:UDP-N-acetylglucosamine diphosphorylase/glucosamine-1-phosphate N-acetyltransferase